MSQTPSVLLYLLIILMIETDMVNAGKSKNKKLWIVAMK